MLEPTIETKYPISFRKKDAERLATQLKRRHSVMLIGMKRVGISNFLRFFLYHPQIIETYLNNPDQRPLFIPIDLYDLVERDLFPFWVLTLKRIVDATENTTLPQSTKKKIESLFLQSIQLKDLFLLLDNIRQSIILLIEAGYTPTLFFIRFDRIAQLLTIDFLSNLRGLLEATHSKLSYVFTSFKSLDGLAPDKLKKASLNAFYQEIYLQPAHPADIETIFLANTKRYNITISTVGKQILFELVDGYIQYLQLALIILNESGKRFEDKDELFNCLISDERINLQSEELWEALTPSQQNVLMKIAQGKEISLEEADQAEYLWHTGYVVETPAGTHIFSLLFKNYLLTKSQPIQDLSSELSKKEFGLFEFLKSKINELCERESIIEAVWPEEEELGVSDWAVDRLVARLRTKLKEQKSSFEIITVKTRGYKLQQTV